MPREIDCPSGCVKGEICESGCGFRMSLQAGSCTRQTCNWKLDCPDCQGTGKITVYTADNIQKAVEDEREACIDIMDGHSQFALEKDMIGKYERITSLNLCIEAIRSRGEP